MPSPQIQDKSTLAALVLYVVAQANDRGKEPTSTQLVKYLYLIDLEYQRVMRRVLTGLRWVYHLYGPYAFELPEITRSLGFDLQTETHSEEGARLYRTSERPAFPRTLPGTAQNVVDRVISIWSEASTREILDHVYFNTGPMKAATRGDALDMTLAGEDEGAYQVVFKASKVLREMKAKYNAPPRSARKVRRALTPPPDETFFEVMSHLDAS